MFSEAPQIRNLNQLLSDANKVGAWEAKVAYAAYVLEHSKQPTEAEKEKVEDYLIDVINNSEVYWLEAIRLYEYFLSEDPIKRQVLAEKTQRTELVNTYSRSISQSPEDLYKKIRSQDSYPNLKIEYIHPTIDFLKNLLANKETTDTLRAKIYFQLIHLHLNLANTSGKKAELDEAEKYCRLLQDPALGDMKKAQKAKIIHAEIIAQASEAPEPIDFINYLKRSFEAGREGNRMLFKYIGIIAGNVADVFMLMLIKHMLWELSENENSKKHSTLYYFLKNTGFAHIFKNAGKLLGKYIVGNLIGGPIGAILGAFTYPFEYLYPSYTSFESSKNIKRIANQTLINKSREFKRKQKDNNKDNPTQELSQSISVGQRANLFTLRKGMDALSPGYNSHPYGSIFNGMKKPSNLTSPEDEYKKIIYTYGYFYNTEEDKEKFINEIIGKLNVLMKQTLTNNLREEIYFQLIRLHLELTGINGKQDELDKAENYCRVLKAIGGDVIKKKVKNIHDQIIEQQQQRPQPVGFTTYIKKSFEAGREGNRMLFKYIGLIAGNLLDFGLLGGVKSYHYTHIAIERDNKKRTLFETVFKRYGFAYLLKNAGKLFGKHIVGNLIGGPIGALLGAITYPFERLFPSYASSGTKENIQRIANQTLSHCQVVFENQRSHHIRNTAQMTRKLDERKKRNSKTIKEEDSVKEENSVIEIENNHPESHMHSNDDLRKDTTPVPSFK